jgi:hypothetical protein
VIPRTVLVIAGRFPPDLSAARAAAAIAKGIRASTPALQTELCSLDDPRFVGDVGSEIRDRRRATERGGLDTRVRGARAVVIARPHLFPGALSPGATFEIATRARQGGVPAYAITTPGTIDLFQARMLDLQVVLQASRERGLRGAGRQLGSVI